MVQTIDNVMIIWTKVDMLKNAQISDISNIEKRTHAVWEDIQRKGECEERGRFQDDS